MDFQDSGHILILLGLKVKGSRRRFVLESGTMLKRLTLVLLCAAFLLPALAPVAGKAGDDAGSCRQGNERKKKDLLLDAAVVGAAVCAYVLVIPDTRRRIFREAQIGKVWQNFRRPFWSAREGGRRDHNGFWINYVGHPLSFMALGLFLKERGYSDLETMAFTQAVSVGWEYVIEGSMWLPSSKDLATDLAGSLVAVFVLAPLSDLGERRIAADDRRWGNRLLCWLNPFKKINPLVFGGRNKALSLHAFPRRGGAVIGLAWVGP
jgi:hypothetical protein